MTFFEWLVMLLTSGVMGVAASAVQGYLAGYWPWLNGADKVQKVAIQIAMSLVFVTGVYWLTVLLDVTPMPATWKAAVNEIGTYALVALGASQVRYQAVKQRSA